MDKKYKKIKKQIFSKGNYSIVPIRLDDRHDIMKWRNEQIYHLRQNTPLSKESQNKYFNNVVNKLFDQEQPNQFLFSYLQGLECIGYGGLVHINWIDKNAEISFIMKTKLEKEHFAMHWKMFLKLIEQFAFKELNFYKIFTFALDLRPNLYKPLEDSDYVKEATLKNHCYFNGVYKDIIIHSKFNPYDKI